MIALSDTWLTDPLFDLEYKQYILQGYIQQAEESLRNNCLFPYTYEINKQVTYVKSTKTALTLPGIEFKEPDSILLIKDLIDFSLPVLKEMSLRYSVFEEWLIKSSSLKLIGLMPLYYDAGYLFFQKNDTLNYTRFAGLPFFAGSAYSSIRFDSPVAAESKDLLSARLEIIDKDNLSNSPATFFLETPFENVISEITLNQTVLPLGSRLIYEFITKK
jgi:hypothetical protein